LRALSKRALSPGGISGLVAIVERAKSLQEEERVELTLEVLHALGQQKSALKQSPVVTAATHALQYPWEKGEEHPAVRFLALQGNAGIERVLSLLENPQSSALTKRHALEVLAQVRISSVRHARRFLPLVAGFPATDLGLAMRAIDTTELGVRNLLAAEVERSSEPVQRYLKIALLRARLSDNQLREDVLQRLPEMGCDEIEFAIPSTKAFAPSQLETFLKRLVECPPISPQSASNLWKNVRGISGHAPETMRLFDTIIARPRTHLDDVLEYADWRLSLDGAVAPSVEIGDRLLNDLLNRPSEILPRLRKLARLGTIRPEQLRESAHKAIELDSAFCAALTTLLDGDQDALREGLFAHGKVKVISACPMKADKRESLTVLLLETLRTESFEDLRWSIRLLGALAEPTKDVQAALKSHLSHRVPQVVLEVMIALERLSLTDESVIDRFQLFLESRSNALVAEHIDREPVRSLVLQVQPRLGRGLGERVLRGLVYR